MCYEIIEVFRLNMLRQKLNTIIISARNEDLLHLGLIDMCECLRSSGQESPVARTAAMHDCLVTVQVFNKLLQKAASSIQRQLDGLQGTGREKWPEEEEEEDEGIANTLCFVAGRLSAIVTTGKHELPYP